MDCTTCTPRKAWDLPFLAEPEEVAALRRVLRVHLRIWGLQELTDAIQLCVSELVANVITHVGVGTPTTLAVSMNGAHLRVEVHDPDTRSLPTLVDATGDAETGRGMALVAATTDRWGVELRGDRKITWCEFATGLNMPAGHCGGRQPSRLRAVATEAAAIDAISDLLHWLRARGCDPEEVIDRAQRHFEAQLEQAAR
ncbi:ATP-binding protein [Streptomyces sp. MBT62]|uniref:ATP-binding protein n=1 Tax=Streptomyces sp. MBT62 TaxID=2800410 RepID=UPI00190919D3|nr:ATP-binding protein [Streptomyces sp. MBT62]MBK3570043.1 ATP-binding protein [Streptomyces sp. MBT62]